MKLVMTEGEYEAYKKIKKGICPGCCDECLIYRLGLECEGPGHFMLNLFSATENDEGIDLEIDNSQF